MSFEAIVELLRARIGLDLASMGEQAGHAAIRTRLRATGLRTIERYYEQLRAQPLELDALVEEIVVPETWFFREQAAFTLLCQRAQAQAISASEPYSALCIPCATGEEPYSIAISLLDAGCAADAIDVHGIDVSQRALAHAERGVYGHNSFRGGVTPSPRHFEPVQGGHTVRAAVRARVRFAQGNVLDTALFSKARFSAVLCRNLLIYLDAPARAASFRNLRTWLQPGGALFVGHAESAIAVEHGMRRTGDAACFAFEVAEATHKRTSTRPRATAAALKPLRTPDRARKIARDHVRDHTPKKIAAMPTAGEPKDPLEQVQALADRGELAGARTQCEALIASAPSAAAYTLLGILRQAGNDLPAARESFERALYLAPRHYEALVHLAFVHERLGQLEVADTLRRRAERCRSDQGAR